MTNNQTEETRDSVEAAVAPDLGTRMSQLIEDPFASALLATGATALAITTVLSTMWVISLILG